jgi:transcriptional regulator with XRE-family HTH domain
VTTAERIKAKMVKQGLTISELARRLEKPKSNISDWVNGHHEPNLDSLRQLAGLLECSVASLIGDEAA